MNERDEFMKKFGDENTPLIQEEVVSPYHATGNNMNVNLDNPQMQVGDFVSSNINTESTIDNTMGMNVQPEVTTPEISQEIPKPIPQPMPEPIIRTEDDNNMDVTEKVYVEQPIHDMQTYQTTTYIANNAQPKGKKVKITIDKETQVVLLMILAIFIFILVLPTISEFFRNLGRS